MAEPRMTRIWSKDLSTDQLNFNLQTLKLDHHVDPLIVGHISELNMELVDREYRHMVMRLSAGFFGMDIGVVYVDTPAGWWSHLRLDWFPRWANRRWPPKTKRETWTIAMLLAGGKSVPNLGEKRRTYYIRRTGEP